MVAVILVAVGVGILKTVEQTLAQCLVTVAQVEDVIEAAAGKLLRNIRLFDIYRGIGVPEGKKSMAFSLELRADDRTLTDTDSEQVITKVLNALKDTLGVTLR